MGDVLTLDDMPKVMRRIALGYKDAVIRAAQITLEKDGLRLINRSIHRTKPMPIDTGDYLASWRVARLADGAMLYSESSPRVKAGVIEYGRRPGVGIPILPLMEWVRRKLGVTDYKQQRSIAFAISMKAKRQGRAGLYPLAAIRRDLRDAFEKRIKVELVKAHRKATRWG